MKKKEVEFAGRTYSCRVVKSNEGEELLIGSTGLRVRRLRNYTMRFFSSPMPEVLSCRMTSWLRC